MSNGTGLSFATMTEQTKYCDMARAPLSRLPADLVGGTEGTID